MPFAHSGKRSALGVGIRAATSQILVLSDSDTMWEQGLLEQVLAPFADPTIGGVGTRQNAYRPGSSIWRRVADWMINVRYLDYVRAQARSGAVACLSGRTVAYRRSVVMPVLEHLVDEFFLGRRCDSGDDGRLTWLGARFRVQDQLSVDGPRLLNVPRHLPRLSQAATALEP